MGVWGPNNFDSDHASDFSFKRSSSPLQLDEEGESVLMPCIDVLATFAENYHFLIADPNKVQQWRDTYLATYDDSIDQLNPQPAYKEQRRGVIVQTFNRLTKACQHAQDA